MADETIQHTTTAGGGTQGAAEAVPHDPTPAPAAVAAPPHDPGYVPGFMNKPTGAADAPVKHDPTVPHKRTPTPGVEKFADLNAKLTEENDKLKHMHAIRDGQFPDEEPVTDEEYHAQHYVVSAAEKVLQAAKEQASKA